MVKILAAWNLRSLFNKRAFLNTSTEPSASSTGRCSTTPFNYNCRSTMASRDCWTGAAASGDWEYRTRGLAGSGAQALS